MSKTNRVGFIKGWIGACHPYPLAMVITLTALIGLASADGSPEAQHFLRVLLAMFYSQLAIGWSNDYLDREVDAVHQPWKPIPSGLVEPQLLRVAIVVALIGAMAEGVSLGVVPLLLLAAGTCAGLAYNTGLKDTRLSALPYVVAFAVLPPFVWTALDVYRGDFLLLYPIAAPLAVAAHFANLLPDLETDAAAGRRNAVVALGRTRTLACIFVALLAPFVALDTSLIWLHYDTALLIATLIVYVTLIAAVGLFYARARDRDAYVWAFRLVALAAVLFAGGWLAAL
ncbi:MAG TPA: UbiA family prenyltransferase [Dehalococcoidia bacterium]|nr:UbiA family prenyltransferase [Dehalococcoidia bacterium]